MDKAVAEAEAIRMWRALPAKDRRTHHQAVAFASQIEPLLQFETLGKRDKIIEGWIVREFLANEAIIERYRVQREQPTAKPASGSARPHPALARNKS